MDQQVFTVRIEGFTLPKNVKRKWEQGKEAAASGRNATLENLEIKLQAAEQRRETIYEARRSKATRYRIRTVHDTSAALERLEKRLAAAEAKRLAVLHAVRVRAAVAANRAAAVARAEAARRKHLQSRLEQSLEAAEVARAAHLADTAARAARTCNKAIANARVAKQREQTQAASRLTTLLHRMKRAEVSRKQVLVARKESAAAVASSAVAVPLSALAAGLAACGGAIHMSISPLHNSSTLLHDVSMTITDTNLSTSLPQQQSIIGANAGEWLRRQAAARRIQRSWRSFTSTEAVASRFVATKIPFSCEITTQAEAAPATEVAATVPTAAPLMNVNISHRQQHQQHNTTRRVDSPTPDPCTSPTSTLPSGNNLFSNNNNNNNNNSGRLAPANTPAENTTPAEGSTPADTPRAGSPRLYGPTTPPMSVPTLSAGMQQQQQQQQQQESGGAPAAPEEEATAANGGRAVPAQNQTIVSSDSVSSMISSATSSLNSRRQPAILLASSPADMTAFTSRRDDETQAPLPASFHDASTFLSFDEFAEAMSAAETLKSAQAVLRRFEDMGRIKESFIRGTVCESLLKRLFPKLPKGKKADRYPPRAFLSAYMIQSHPEVVLSQQGPRETALLHAAGTMLAAFENLLSRFLPSSSTSSSSSVFSLLRQFDESWVAYLELFIAWKTHDAAGLESELIRAAVELETSRLLKLSSSRAAAANNSTTMPSPRAAARAEATKQDIEALVEGVDHDLKLISERVERLTGRQGAARLEAALAAARASAEQQQQLQNSMMLTDSSSSSQHTSAAMMTSAHLGASAPSPSPSNSPAKKVQRRQGQYANTSSSRPSSPEQASPTEVEEVEVGNEINADSGFHQEQQQQQQKQSDGNLVLMWQLLYDSTWHLPTDEAESSWNDAVGETDPMSEPAPTPREMEALLHHQYQGGGGLVGSEALAAALHTRVRRIAEKAFWDDLAERLSSNGITTAAAAGSRPGSAGSGETATTNNDSNSTTAFSSAVCAAVGILAEAGAALRAVLPEGSSAAADVCAQLGSAERLAELLTATPNIASSSYSSSLLPGINCDALFQMLEWCGGLLRRLGTPAREAAATAAQASIRNDLASATTSADAGKIVARALRLIAVLLKLLRLDMANAHLGMLARQLGTTPERAALYAHSKMEDFLGTAAPSPGKTMTEESKSLLGSSSSVAAAVAAAREMALKLPHTRGWLALASGRLPHIEALLLDASASTLSVTTSSNTVPASVSSQETAAALQSAGVPHRLTTGRGRAGPSSTTGSTAAATNTTTSSTSNSGLAGQLAAPISPKTWQGLVRCGLAQLVAGEGAVTHLALPETLTPDSGRLQGAQNEFQRLVVLTASLLALQHASRVATSTTATAAAAGGAPGGSNAATPASVSMSTSPTAETAKRRLSAVLASPDVCLADIAAEVTSLAQAPEQEASVNAILRSMLGKSSAALRSITSGLCNALNAYLILGPSSPDAFNAAHAALTRCGAGALGPEVASLGGKLAEVAAVTEAVCGPWYEVLTSDLII